MARERSRRQAKEIAFTGAYTKGLIVEGGKLLTIRSDDPKYAFSVGENVKATFPDQRTAPTDIVILKADTQKLSEVPPALMALDGFFSNDEALDTLRYHYKDLTLESNISAIGFISRYKLDTLSDKQADALLTQPMEEAVKDPTLREVFLPSIANYAAYRYMHYNDTEESRGNKKGVDDYVRFLGDSGIIPKRQAAKIIKESPFKEERGMELDTWIQRMLMKGYEEPTDKYYRKYILASPPSEK